MPKLTGRRGRAHRARARAPGGKSGATCLLVRNLDQLKALADPLRLRVLRAFAHEPRTAKQVAESIGEKPGRLYHHMAVLERVGLLEITHTRQVRGTVEKHYRAVASRFEVDGALLSDSPPAEAAAKRIELVTSLLAQTRSEFLESHGRRRAATAGPRPILARMVMSGTPKEIAALVRRIQSLVTECAPQGDAECLSAPRGQYVLTLVGYALPDGRDKTAAEPQAP